MKKVLHIPAIWQPVLKRTMRNIHSFTPPHPKVKSVFFRFLGMYFAGLNCWTKVNFANPWESSIFINGLLFGVQFAVRTIQIIQVYRNKFVAVKILIDSLLLLFWLHLKKTPKNQIHTNNTGNKFLLNIDEF